MRSCFVDTLRDHKGKEVPLREAFFRPPQIKRIAYVMEQTKNNQDIKQAIGYNALNHSFFNMNLTISEVVTKLRAQHKNNPNTYLSPTTRKKEKVKSPEINSGTPPQKIE